IEHLVLVKEPDRIVAEAAIIGGIDENAFAARYKIVCDSSWCVMRVELDEVGSGRAARLKSDGNGNWIDESGHSVPEVRGAIDIDISATPFTNTLPIRRLSLARGQSEEILALYIRVPDLSLTTDQQRYTCLEPGKRYRYDSLDSDFTRDIE